ncbi:TSUP family transporter [Nocardioides sp. J2M5]|uniref:TSUP family transporter n=1 Tax=Nocardioides palaemonis TaxID=2829810 RepID=UPI001BAC59F6|nr:TSUP family transporter [Nocardioides palaemonis]MBS2937652.1 TSUP family transporter [Nocardioides palaemonis]
MTLALTIALGLLIGAVLGGLGGGGAILTVPALVYLIGQPAQDATTSSLVIVGLTAAVGMASYLSSNRVRWAMGLTFGIVGLPATWLGSYLNHRVDQHLLLLGFSVLMLVAAAAMIGDQRGTRTTPGSDRPEGPRPAAVVKDPSGGTGRLRVLERTAEPVAPARYSPTAVVAVALTVGLLTGFFGVGGGFVVVPALVLVLRLPMQQAVGTSLMIVALNSATSLVARAGGTARFDWDVIIPFTVAAMVATLVGKTMADRLPARRLKIGFAALLVLVAGYTAWQSLEGLLGDSSTATSPTSSTAVASPAAVRRAIVEGAVTLDVRTPAEYDAGHLDGARNLDIAAADFDAQLSNLDPTATYVVYCASGRRAAAAIEHMTKLGFDHLRNGGGYDALAQAGLPTVPETPAEVDGGR